MASFQKYTTKDGVRWMYKYYSTIDPETGKKKPSTKRGFKTKKEAQLDAARTEQQLAEGTFITEDKSSVTFEQVFKQWFETISSTYKPSTRKAVLSKFNKRILPHFRKLKMKDISRAYCQDVINKVAEEIKSVDNMKMYANQIFEYAITKEILVNNPLKGVIIPKKDEEFIVNEDEPERNYWEKHEIKEFLEFAKRECTMRDYLMFHLLIYTGGRKGEVLALRWSDIDFKAKTIHFNKTLFYEKGKYVSLTSKTAASRRFISMDDTTAGLLKKYRTGQSGASVVHLHSKDNEMVFTREDGSPLRLAYPNDKLDEITKSNNLHPITVHGLRHTHASLLFEAGASIKEVQERLGHSDIKMTMNIYTHVTRTVKEQTASRFEKFMEL
ncbi:MULTISPECIES: tyrosine-type recombinase/integrase [unclassified Brevibacillus]|uniref:site-specific integrase n=1 Tax=unclassified Brevibacillus TaxID=2684853 RepID=UPI003568C96B